MNFIEKIWDWLWGPMLYAGANRSGQWPKVRKEMIAKGGECQACRAKDALEVHHIVPFHVLPTLELDPSNLMVLCRECHFHIGHLRDWESWNVRAWLDASDFRLARDLRPKLGVME